MTAQLNVLDPDQPKHVLLIAANPAVSPRTETRKLDGTNFVVRGAIDDRSPRGLMS